VRAIRERASALIRLDLPTFERPTSATWGRQRLGQRDLQHLVHVSTM
jgi:hypothetical protein